MPNFRELAEMIENTMDNAEKIPCIQEKNKESAVKSTARCKFGLAIYRDKV
ncbi:MAG: hypothetical protein IJD99_07925 [Clostridia bacterium]|nr:hypothetical protein [Clostridia bacterium]